MKRTILVIEDVEEMSKLIAMFLESAGYGSVTFETAEEALEWMPGNTFDLVLLDLNLPGIDGFEFLGRARKFTSVPVLIVTARESDEDLITGLGYGADDFLSKPFSSGVLLARVRALLRRSELSPLVPSAENRVVFGPFSFDRHDFVLRKGQERISLSMREYGVLDYLISNAGIPKSPQTIYDAVWKNKYGDLTTVAVYIQRLRRKLEDDPANPVYICTEFGKGYYFHLPESSETTHEA
jgi:DNA-binding response OmpR family regulator